MTSPSQWQNQCDGNEYEKLHNFFLEAVGIATMAVDDFYKPYLDDLLRRARAELKPPTPSAESGDDTN